MEGRSKAKLDFRMNAPANLLSHTSHTFHQRAHQLPILLRPSFVYTPPFPPPLPFETESTARNALIFPPPFPIPKTIPISIRSQRGAKRLVANFPPSKL